jgi:hypothetical protein
MDALIIGPPENPDVRLPRLPDALVEQLAELWCEALLANLQRYPIQPEIRKAS